YRELKHKGLSWVCRAREVSCDVNLSVNRPRRLQLRYVSARPCWKDFDRSEPIVEDHVRQEEVGGVGSGHDAILSVVPDPVSAVRQSHPLGSQVCANGIV